ncbi:MAG: PIG-L family deacetylase [Chloroflexi bacterium]|nr:PIG-L family deacetylase [Chloroflexota bacterium]OJW02110.1 MAG: GlcNAc-PI de-N-acetylase [Chloroflexi bacterium 54-19]
MHENAKLRVLAIGAHPDDLEFQIGGTLAKYAERGHQVFMAVTTNGEVGSSTLSREEIARIRYEEAKSSAETIGAELIWVGYNDEFFFDNEESRRRFIDIIRLAEPDVVLTHWVEDYHPDHFNTGKVVRDARIMTAVPNIVTEHVPLKKIPQLFFYDTVAGINFVPEVYVNVTGTFETKKKMLSCHKSQDAWLRDIYDMTYIEFMEVQTRFRGLQSGFKYAEGFRALETYPRISNYNILPFE